MIIFPFFVICLYKGQRPMDVPQVEDSFYNVRFGLMMLMPTAVFAGYLPAAIGRLFKFKSALYLVGTSLLALTLLLNWSSCQNTPWPPTANQAGTYTLDGPPTKHK